MAEKYLRMNKSRLNEFDQALLSRMRLGRYSVIKVESTGKNGEIHVMDIFLQTEFTLVDQQLSKSAEPGLGIAGHIVDLGEFSIQSGASLPVDQTLMMTDEVQQVLQNIGGNSDDDFQLHPADCAKLARAIIAAAIRLGYTEDVRYFEV